MWVFLVIFALLILGGHIYMRKTKIEIDLTEQSTDATQDDCGLSGYVFLNVDKPVVDTTDSPGPSEVK